MYLNDIIDRATRYFTTNEDADGARLMVRAIRALPLPLDAAAEGYAAHVVDAEKVRRATAFSRRYLVVAFPDGEVTTFEIGSTEGDAKLADLVYALRRSRAA